MQCLPDRVESVPLGDLKRTATGLGVELEHLRLGRRAVDVFQCHGPDLARHRAGSQPFKLMRVAEEPGQVAGSDVNVQAAAHEVLQVSEAVGEGVCELLGRGGTSLANVVATDGHGVKLADVFLGEELLDITHHLDAEIHPEDALILCLDLLEDICLHSAAESPPSLVTDAVDRGEGEAVLRVDVVGLSGSIGCRGHARTRLHLLDLAGVVTNVALQRPLGRSVEVHSQDLDRRPVDCEGGGDLVEVEVVVEDAHVRQRVHSHATLADLAQRARVVVRVGAVQGDAVEGRAEPGCRDSVGKQVEALVGVLGQPQTGKLASGVHGIAAEREGAGDEGVVTREAFLKQEPHHLDVVVLGEGDFGNLNAVVRGVHELPPGGELVPLLPPRREQLTGLVVQAVDTLVAHRVDLLLSVLVVLAHSLDHPADVIAAAVRDKGQPTLRLERVQLRLLRGGRQAQQLHDVAVDVVGARVAWHLCDRRQRRCLAARGSQLLVELGEGSARALPVRLVEHDNVGILEQLVLVQLDVCRAKFLGLNVDGNVRSVLAHINANLSAAGCLHNGQVVRVPQFRDDDTHGLRESLVRGAGCDRPHEDTIAVDAVHAHAVTEQRGFLPLLQSCRVHTYDRHPLVLAEIIQVLLDECVGHGGLAATTITHNEQSLPSGAIGFGKRSFQLLQQW
mmetsp:Transcript_21153/g.49585  ORF Transcript_21153/g.49585 Transcript_21153/m.49585 type:complete len:676 (-) Transcript_21153:670-2697(-)